MTLLGNIMAEGRVRLEAAEAINQQDVQRGSSNSSRPHSHLQNEDISKAPSPPQAQTFCDKSPRGWIRETDFQID